MGDIKPIEYPFILIFKGSEERNDEMCLYDNELTHISIENLSKKGYKYAEIKTFTSKEGAEAYFIENADEKDGCLKIVSDMKKRMTNHKN